MQVLAPARPAEASGPLSLPTARRLLRIGFGALWTLDALLQLQPGMFRMDMVSDIMQPAATGQPAFLQRSIDASIALVTPHLALFNWAIVLIQAFIGLSLLSGRPGLVRTGAVAAIVWSLLVWWFGEGLGQLLTGSATFLTGAPGSVFLYGLAAVLLLLPTSRWQLRYQRLPLPSFLAALVFLLGAALQLNPLFFTGLGLAAPFGQGAMMPQPAFILASLGAAADLAGRAPLVLNLLLTLVLAGSGFALFLRPASRPLAFLLTAFLLVVWWFGQDVGGLFTGMATDPNTAVPLALLVWSGLYAAKAET
jgi:hypothetical protein